MIFLDEQMIGRDQNVVVIRSIILCGGLIARLSNGSLAGAHFDPGIPAGIITAGLNYIQNTWLAPATIAEAFFFYRAASWSQRADILSTAAGLSAHLKAGLGMGGEALHMCDKGALNDVGPVDIRAVNAGNAMLLTWRDHPGGPRTVALNPDVRYLPNVNPPAVNAAIGGHAHCTSDVGGGWQHLAVVT